MANPAYVWWNGDLVRWEDATVHASALGWSTIGAVFEGLRAYWNPEHEELYLFRLDEHLRRFGDSMRLVRLEQTHSPDALTAAIIGLLRANAAREDTYILPLAYRGGDGKGRFGGIAGPTEILVRSYPLPSHLGSGRGERVGISSWTRISEGVMPPRVKGLANYRNAQLASMEAADCGYDSMLLLNAQGKVAEGGGACVMLVRDGALITPDITQSILESITRAALLTLARGELGVRVVERAVDRTELYIADEVFLCGTAAEITPVFSVDRHRIGAGGVGPLTGKLEALLGACLRNRAGARAEWITPVGGGRPVGA